VGLFQSGDSCSPRFANRRAGWSFRHTAYVGWFLMGQVEYPCLGYGLLPAALDTRSGDD
jgi:hypothetical protein